MGKPQDDPRAFAVKQGLLVLACVVFPRRFTVVELQCVTPYTPPGKKHIIRAAT